MPAANIFVPIFGMLESTQPSLKQSRVYNMSQRIISQGAFSCSSFSLYLLKGLSSG